MATTPPTPKIGMILRELASRKFRESSTGGIAFLRKMRYDVTHLNEVKNIEPENVMQL